MCVCVLVCDLLYVCVVLVTSCVMMSGLVVCVCLVCVCVRVVLNVCLCVMLVSCPVMLYGLLGCA